MNKVTFAALLCLMFSTGLALAQDSTPSANSAPASTTAAAPSNSGMPEYPGKIIAARIKNQYKRIKAGVKSKTLTMDEAKTLKAKVDAVRAQLKADVMQNKQTGVKKITDDQYSQLKQMLDDNSKAIHDEKNDGASDANSSSSEDASSAAASSDKNSSDGDNAAPAGNASSAPATASTTPTNQ